MNTPTKFYDITVPAAPPVPPDGYRLTGYMVLDQRGGRTDLMNHEVGTTRYQREHRLDLDVAVRVWAENGIKTYDLWAMAECEIRDAEGDLVSYEANCQFDGERFIAAGWQPWLNASNLRDPAVSLEQIRSNSDTPFVQPVQV